MYGDKSPVQRIKVGLCRAVFLITKRLDVWLFWCGRLGVGAGDSENIGIVTSGSANSFEV